MFSRLKAIINNRLIRIIQGKNSIEEDKSDLQVTVDNPIKLTIRRMKTIKVDTKEDYKWCGAVLSGRCVYGIPTGIGKVIKFDIDSLTYTYVGELGDGSYKWTGAGICGDIVYGFPRKENSILKINTRNDDVELIPIATEYGFEHHYGGTIYKDTVFQPPRNCNHILSINILSNKSRKIKLTHLPVGFQYCGTYMHPNGNIYFLPERNERVIEFEPQNNKINYIGNYINSTTFSVCILDNGCLAGFSAYDNGILFINPEKKEAKMIHEEIGVTGCCSNVILNNGCVYGMPADGDYLWEYNPYLDKVTKVLKCKNEEIGNRAKIGSSVVAGNTIIGLPARGQYIYIMEFEEETC